MVTHPSNGRPVHEARVNWSGDRVICAICPEWLIWINEGGNGYGDSAGWKEGDDGVYLLTNHAKKERARDRRLARSGPRGLAVHAADRLSTGKDRRHRRPESQPRREWHSSILFIDEDILECPSCLRLNRLHPSIIKTARQKDRDRREDSGELAIEMASSAALLADYMSGDLARRDLHGIGMTEQDIDAALQDFKMPTFAELLSATPDELLMASALDDLARAITRASQVEPPQRLE